MGGSPRPRCSPATPSTPPSPQPGFFPIAYAVFICRDHASLPGDLTFRDNLLNILLHQAGRCRNRIVRTPLPTELRGWTFGDRPGGRPHPRETLASNAADSAIVARFPIPKGAARGSRGSMPATLNDAIAVPHQLAQDGQRLRRDRERCTISLPLASTQDALEPVEDPAFRSHRP